MPAGRDVISGEINVLVDACYCDKNEALAIREQAIIGLLYTTGMRRSELAGLSIEDYDAGENKLFIQHGKRNKQRFIYIANGAKAPLDEWVAMRGSESGAIFLSIRKDGKNELTGITMRYAAKTCETGRGSRFHTARPAPDICR